MRPELPRALSVSVMPEAAGFGYTRATATGRGRFDVRVGVRVTPKVGVGVRAELLDGTKRSPQAATQHNETVDAAAIFVPIDPPFI